MSDHKRITSIEIRDASGAVKHEITGGRVFLKSETPFSLTKGEDESLTISMNDEQAVVDPYYEQKLLNILQGGSVTGKYDFSTCRNSEIYIRKRLYD